MTKKIITCNLNIFAVAELNEADETHFRVDILDAHYHTQGHIEGEYSEATKSLLISTAARLGSKLVANLLQKEADKAKVTDSNPTPTNVPKASA